LDLSKLRTDGPSGAVFTPLDPSNRQPYLSETDGSPMTITLASPESDAGRKARRKLLDAIKDKKGSLTPDESDELDAELLANVTLAWTNIEWEGEPLACTIANARKIYSVPGLAWLRRDALAFYNTTGNFLPPSQTN
jgi:hypothetical protein